VTVGGHQQREVFYRGRVQGVGFRYTVSRIAARFAVTGYVRNLSDGRVLVVAEGPEDELDRFLEAVLDELSQYIRGKNESLKPGTGQFARFEIRY
jgi:acylphosphatase